MTARIGKLLAAGLAASLALSGCATTGSVKRAQGTADQALAQGQTAHDAARKAQSSADDAANAAQRAQSSADAAGNTAQGAYAAAQNVADSARSNRSQIDKLVLRVKRLERQHWLMTHRHHRAKHRHAK